MDSTIRLMFRYYYVFHILVQWPLFFTSVAAAPAYYRQVLDSLTHGNFSLYQLLGIISVTRYLSSVLIFLRKCSITIFPCFGLVPARQEKSFFFFLFLLVNNNSLSLSLSLYIYIYTHTHTQKVLRWSPEANLPFSSRESCYFNFVP
ncbi:hypothetical protein IEQ34_011597 [Dendrobium chrysotoxum]|uniref:Uncharacterized protein n=1 Tax=Dendrobium chrysotoxum TaxID=161865 RepID=A0AAV7GSM9_DENCH|nr:hypothetical protein IEQ34_011597 [Dendrobium chrysotoxum]